MARRSCFGNLRSIIRFFLRQADDGYVKIRCNSRKENSIQKRLGTYHQYQLDRKRDDYIQSMVYVRYKLKRWAECEKLRDGWSSKSMPLMGLPPSLACGLNLDEWWTLYREEHWEAVAKEARKYVDFSRRGIRGFDGIYVRQEVISDLSKPSIDEVELSMQCLKYQLRQYQQRLL